MDLDLEGRDDEMRRLGLHDEMDAAMDLDLEGRDDAGSRASTFR